jgi:hypothetical protein
MVTNVLKGRCPKNPGCFVTKNMLHFSLIVMEGNAEISLCQEETDFLNQE